MGFGRQTAGSLAARLGTPPSPSVNDGVASAAATGRPGGFRPPPLYLAYRRAFSHALRGQRECYGLGYAWGAELTPNSTSEILLCTPENLGIALELALEPDGQVAPSTCVSENDYL